MTPRAPYYGFTSPYDCQKGKALNGHVHVALGRAGQSARVVMPCSNRVDFLIRALPLLHPSQGSNWDGAVLPRSDLPGKFITFQLVRTHRRGVIPIRHGGAIGLKGDRVLDGIEGVATKTHAHAEGGVLVLFESPLELVTRGEF
jgi:hypothetical protein